VLNPTTRYIRLKNLFFAAVALLAIPLGTIHAATIAMNGTDAIGTASFNTGLHWTGGLAPTSGNAYQTSTFLLRSPADANAITFAGDSLNVQGAGGNLRLKTAATVTVNNLILDDGAVVDLTAPTGGNNATLAGNITLNGTATFQSGIQAAESANTLTISSAIGGAGGFNTAGSFGTIILSGTNSYAGVTTVSGGTLSIAGPNGGGAAAALIVGNAANMPATLNILPGATITNYNLVLGGNATGPGAILQSGGTLTQVQAANTANFRIGDATSAYGYYQLSGGTLNANEVGVGGGNGGNATVGVMDITGGTFNNAGWITIGRGGTTSSGALNVSGSGVIQLAGTVGGSHMALNWAGTAGAFSVLNIFNGGTVNGPANAAYWLDLSAANTAGTLSVVNLNSNGTLAIGGLSANANPNTFLNFNGGTLKAVADNVAFLPAGNADGIYLYPGGATIHDGGFAIAASAPLLAPTGYGVSSIPLANGGSGYIGAPLVSITGGTGIGATAIAQFDSVTHSITNLLVTSPGTGYASGDALTVSFLGGGGHTRSVGKQ